MATTYEIQLRYALDDKASQALSNLTQRASHTETKLLDLRGALAAVGVAFGVNEIVKGGAKAFIGFNSEVEQSKISLAALASMFNKDLKFDAAMSRADDFFTYYQAEAKRSIGTTQDFLEMHRAIAPAMEKAGASIADFKQITVGAATSAGLFGARPDVAALDIQQMLAGSVTVRDRMASQLIAMSGMTTQKFNEMAQQSSRFAVDFLKKAFSTEALRDARNRMEHSFEGALSTLKDSVQIGLGKAGERLKDAITGTLNDLNRWLADHSATIDKLSEQLSSHLINGFSAMQTAVAFVVNHKDDLIKIGEAYLAIKAATMVGGLASAGVSAGQAGLAFLTQASTTAVVGGLASTVAAVLGTFVISAAVGALIAEHFDDAAAAAAKHTENLKKNYDYEDAIKQATLLERQTAALKSAGPALPMLEAREEGVFGPTQTLVTPSAAIARQTLRTDREIRALLSPILTEIKEAGAFTGADINTEEYTKYLAQRRDLDQQQIDQRMQSAEKAFEMYMARFGIEGIKHFFGIKDVADKPGGNLKPPNVNVNINRIEVASDDPDRFVQVLATKAAQAIRSPGAAKDALSTHIY